MRLHFLVEGPADETFLNLWLPRFLPDGHTFKIIRHRGKGKIPADPTSSKTQSLWQRTQFCN